MDHLKPAHLEVTEDTYDSPPTSTVMAVPSSSSSTQAPPTSSVLDAVTFNLKSTSAKSSHAQDAKFAGPIT